MALVCLSAQVRPEFRERLREIAKKYPGITVHQTTKALLELASELEEREPGQLAKYLQRYA